MKPHQLENLPSGTPMKLSDGRVVTFNRYFPNSSFGPSLMYTTKRSGDLGGSVKSTGSMIHLAVDRFFRLHKPRVKKKVQKRLNFLD